MTEITQLYKGLSFANKKTGMTNFDDYVFIENGVFLIQDAFKSFTIFVRELENSGNFLLKKQDLLNIKTASTAYFVEGIINNVLRVKTVKKGEENIVDLPLINRCFSLTKVLDRFDLGKNHVSCNGVALKESLKGYTGGLIFSSKNGELSVVSTDDSSVDFTDVFRQLCGLNVITSDGSSIKVHPVSLVSALTALKLVKKDNLFDLYYNTDVICVEKGNLKLYMFALK